MVVPLPRFIGVSITVGEDEAIFVHFDGSVLHVDMGMEGFHSAVNNGSFTVFRISPHVIKGIGLNVGHAHGIVTFAHSVFGMTAIRIIKGWLSDGATPTHTPLSGRVVALAGQPSHTHSRVLSDVDHIERGHHRIHDGFCRERLVGTVSRTCTIGCVSTHIVRSVFGKSRQFSGKIARSCRTGEVIAINVWVLRGAPTDTTFCYGRPAVSSNIAITFCSNGRDTVHIICHYGGNSLSPRDVNKGHQRD